MAPLVTNPQYSTPKLPPLVIIVGPTASGKSALAMQLAKQFNGEIICADSRTVYKYLNIGTAKPSAEDQAEVPHHLLDVVEPNQTFTAAEFQRQANKAIEDITARGMLPIMVGGTGLYIDAVVFNYEFGKPADPEFRTKLNEMTVGELQGYCAKNNIPLPENSKNRRHLIRAIELGGLSDKRSRRIRDNTVVLGISVEKDILRTRVSKRAEQIFANGVVDEATMVASHYGWGSEAMTGIIYRIIHQYVEGRMTKPEALDVFISADMQLAKRQMTWFKRNPHIVWSDDTKELTDKVEQFYNALADSR